MKAERKRLHFYCFFFLQSKTQKNSFASMFVQVQFLVTHAGSDSQSAVLGPQGDTCALAKGYVKRLKRTSAYLYEAYILLLTQL